MMGQRKFDIVVLGATGYTGTICAEHIIKTFPTNLKWAIAGRSSSALEDLCRHLKEINPDRSQPEPVTINFTSDDLNSLAQNTRVLINGVGPYHRFSTPVVEACATSGTHYVDFSTETPWIKEMVNKYHSVAKKSGAILISAISNSSSPSNLIAWLIATAIRERGITEDIKIESSAKLKIAGMAYGSFITILDTMDTYGTSWLNNSDPKCLSPEPETSYPPSKPQKLPFYHVDPTLGKLSTSFTAASNVPMVYRSAALDPTLYGANFSFSEYAPVSSYFEAVVTNLFTKLFVFVLGFATLRTQLRKLAFAPGKGPALEEARKGERADFHAVATVPGAGKAPVTLKAGFVYEGALSEISAMLAVEAAGVLLQKSREADNGDFVGEGGYLTPSSLGMPFVERLREVGVKISLQSI